MKYKKIYVNIHNKSFNWWKEIIWKKITTLITAIITAIKTDPIITIEQDLARRDITINSIAKEVLTGKIIDPFDGRKDIENKIIRATTLETN